MSADGPGSREVAHRLFAAEFDDADLSYSESDEERAPNYVVTPTGARVNRLFVVGVLTEVEQVNEEMLRARVVDPTGAFVVYAGQYQPDALAFLERTDPPAFLAVTGKARTFQPEDSDRVFTSVRPESISRVDAETRDQWVVQAAERTLERVGTMAAAIACGLTGDVLRAALEADGVDPSLASGIPLALDHYGTTPDYLAAVHDLAVQALETIASDREEVESFAVSPADGAGDANALATRELSVPADAERAVEEPATPESSTENDATTPTDEQDAERVADTSASVPDDTDAEETAPGGDAEEPVAAEPATDDAGSEESGSATASDAAADDPGEFEPDEASDPDEEVLSDEERAEAEELGGFSTGNEIEESAESGDAAASDVDETAAAEPESADVDAAAAEDEPADGAEEPESEADDDAGDVSLEESVMDAMTELDDGDGAEHDAIVETVVDRTGADPDAVDEAIQDALMSGQCYEPDDGVFKPI